MHSWTGSLPHHTHNPERLPNGHHRNPRLRAGLPLRPCRAPSMAGGDGLPDCRITSRLWPVHQQGRRQAPLQRSAGLGPVQQPVQEDQSPRLKGYLMDTPKKGPRGPKARLAARLASGAKRVCNTKDCNTVLSVYNDDDICSKCFNAIPINERPYKYRASF